MHACTSDDTIQSLVSAATTLSARHIPFRCDKTSLGAEDRRDHSVPLLLVSDGILPPKRHPTYHSFQVAACIAICAAVQRALNTARLAGRPLRRAVLSALSTASPSVPFTTVAHTVLLHPVCLPSPRPPHLSPTHTTVSIYTLPSLPPCPT